LHEIGMITHLMLIAATMSFCKIIQLGEALMSVRY
jgi:hypothetical protein